MQGSRTRGDQKISSVEPVSEILKHARQINFALSVASFVIITTFLFQSDGEHSSVNKDYEVVEGLISHWNASASAAPSGGVSIASVFDLPYETIQYNLANFYGVQTDNLILIESVDPGPGINPTGCDMNSVLLPPVFLQLEDGAVTHIVLRNTDDPDFFRQLTEGNLSQYSLHNGINTGRIRSLGEFVAFWNFLARAQSIVTISSLPQQKAIGYSFVYDENDDPTGTNYFELEFSSAAIEPFVRANLPAGVRPPLGNGGIWRRDNYLRGFRTDVFGDSLPDMVAQILEKTVDSNYLALTICRFAPEIEENGANSIYEPTIEFLIALNANSSALHWQSAWVSAAVSANYLTENRLARASTHFSEAFPSLANFVAGLGDISTSDLRARLDEAQQAQIKNQAQQIEIVGLKVNSDIMRFGGIFLIVIIQGYLLIHLVEANERIEKGAIDKKAPHMPWVLVYDGWQPRLAYLTMSCLLPVAAGVTVIFWALKAGEGLLYWVALAIVAAIGLSLIVILSWRLSVVGKEISVSLTAQRKKHSHPPERKRP